MKKFLFCGDVNGQWITLLDRVQKLQNSQHGPFDGLFCTGTFFESSEEYAQLASTLEFPIPTFAVDRTGHSPDIRVPNNVVFLDDAGLEMVCGVKVCSLSRNPSAEQLEGLLKKISDPYYKGCDIMISAEWPAHILQLLSESEYQTVKALGLPLSGGSESVAKVAFKAQPRMHFTASMNICYERPAYRCTGDSSDAVTHDTCTFFYSLAGLPGGSKPAATGDEKARRWMKAMSCEPMAVVGSRIRPLAPAAAVAVTDSPYGDVFEPKRQAAAGQKRPREADGDAPRRPPPPPNPPPNTTTSFFFGETRTPKGGRSGPQVNLLPPSDDATLLFIGGIPALPADAAENILRPLFPTAVRVSGVNDKPFAFVELASHAEALTIVSAQADSSAAIKLPEDLGGGVLSIGWGKAKGSEDRKRPDRIPASHSDDCWFCLASPVVKVHLVVSVSDHAYLSLPRGGMDDLHVLAVPIECNPNRLHVSPEARRDLDRYCNAVSMMYEGMGCRLMCYERAIRTKGRDHMQLHLVPVPSERLTSSVQTFFEACGKFKLKFQEIMGGASVEDTVDQLASHIGVPEYFYISVPVGSAGQSKRFIYIHEPGARFTMHFGSEVAAAIIGKPDRANWKNCLQDEPQEMELAARFRTKFEPFDFTLR